MRLYVRTLVVKTIQIKVDVLSQVVMQAVSVTQDISWTEMASNVIVRDQIVVL